MSANYKQLMDFQKKIEKLNNEQKDQFLQACCKELAARLLQMVTYRTPVGNYSGEEYDCNQRVPTGNFHHKGNKQPGMSGGTLRRSWSIGEIRKVGNTYQIDVINPIEYASYVEYGHRTPDHNGFVKGHYMLTLSENDIKDVQQGVLEKKLEKYLKKAFEE